MIEKNHIRTHFRKKRRAIGQTRRREAHQRSLKSLSRLFEQHNFILSYASFGDEFDTWSINHLLANSGKLLLPKVEGKNMRIFHIENIEKQLKSNSWGILEPIPSLCQEVHNSFISLTLVPGLAFDRSHHRLGYGKGYYDRLLSSFSVQSFGLGFTEQLSSGPLPTMPTDISLFSLLLF